MLKLNRLICVEKRLVEVHLQVGCLRLDGKALTTCLCLKSLTDCWNAQMVRIEELLPVLFGYSNF